MKPFDAVIIGGGPAGLTAALYLLRSEIKVALVEKLSHGGQVLMTERIDNYPGFPKGVLGYELADIFNAQVVEWDHGNLTRYMDEVRMIEATENGAYRLRIGEEEIEARCVLIASGSRYKKLGTPGERELTGRGVSYCALCDGNFFRDQEVAVIGGGNSALEEALYLTRLVKKIYLIHRREDFRGAKCYQDRCFVHPKMAILRSTVVESINGVDKVESLTIRDMKTGELRDMPIEGVFIFVGFEPHAGFFPPGLECDALGFIKTDQEMHTNIPGIFAAGDIRSKNCRQVATAVGDGATAAHAMMQYLEHHNV